MNSRRNQAFTLIELTVVVTLIAIAVATISLNLTHLSNKQRLQSAAHQIGELHRLARIAAISSGQPRHIVFDQAVELQEPRFSHEWEWSAVQVLDLGPETQARLILDGQPVPRGGVVVRSDGTAPSYTCVVQQSDLSVGMAIDGVGGWYALVDTVDPGAQP